MTDHVRVWSDELARDPSSLVFLPLAETLRRRGQIDLARKVAMRGIERHPHNPDAHDQLARIHADAGDLQAAYDEWDVVLRLVPGHAGAMKGMAFVRFQQGAFEDAEQLLLGAQQQERDNPDISAAIRTVRRSGSITPTRLAAVPEALADVRLLFADLLGAGHAAILLDREGLVLAGSYPAPDGRDVAEDVGAALSGVSGEATRATRHLGIGNWRSIVFETDNAVVSIAPSGGAAVEASAGALVMVTAPPATPLGLLRRLLDRCAARAGNWLAGGGPA